MAQSKRQHLVARFMKENIRDFLVSFSICAFAALLFWYINEDASHPRYFDYLSDYFFISGVAFWVVGMAIALFMTSRLHYYRHLKKKWQGKEDDETFDKGETERKRKMCRGIAIALSGLAGFIVSWLTNYSI